MLNKYWLVQIDNEYIVNDDHESTLLKTRAGRLRNKDVNEMKEVMREPGISMLHVTFVATTYKPKGTEFIIPRIWWWINRPRDDFGVARGNRKGKICCLF